MKRLISLCFGLLLAVTVLAQANQVKITHRNGSVLQGTLLQYDPATAARISIAGVEMEIPAADIVAIAAANSPATSVAQSQIPKEPTPEVSLSEHYGEYVVTDNRQLPESFVLQVGDEEYKMILVRGGVFNMGYDGGGSSRMDSEPVHRVTLSSFYVGAQLVNNTIASEAIAFKRDKKATDMPYRTSDWKNAKHIADYIAAKEELPYRLLTEAEWEYTAIQPEHEFIFAEVLATRITHPVFKEHVGEWCNDLYQEEYFPAAQVNPQGPTSGKKHTIRTYHTDKHKWNRDLSSPKLSDINSFFVRLAISADDVIDYINKVK